MEEEKSYQEITDIFINKYKKNFLPELIKIKYQKLNKNFFKLTKKDYLNLVFGIIFTELFLLFMYMIAQDGGNFVVIPMFFIMPILGTIMYIPVIKKRQKKDIKKILMPEICKCFPNLQYFPSDKVDMQKLNDAGLPTTCEVDDSFIGQFKGIYFKILELRYLSSGKNPRYIIPYLLVQFRLNKCFNGHTVIYPDYYKKAPLKNLHHTELEDIIFEQKYNVFTNDDVEARYLITPSFMEKLKNIQYEYKSNYDQIFVSFYKETFSLLIKTKGDLFGLDSILKNPNCGDEYIWLYEIFSIFKLIDYFQLDKKTGL